MRFRSAGKRICTLQPVPPRQTRRGARIARRLAISLYALMVALELLGVSPARAQSIEIDPVDHRTCLLEIGSTSGTQVSNICPAQRLNVWYCLVGGSPFTQNQCRHSNETRGPWDGSPSWQLDYLDTTPGLGDFVATGDPPQLFLAACLAESGWYLRGGWDASGRPIYDCRRNTGGDGDPPDPGGEDDHVPPPSGAFMQGRIGWAQVGTSQVQLNADAVGFRCASGVSGTSGSLRLRLIAQEFPSPDGSYYGYVLGELPLDPLNCNSQYTNVSATVPWASPYYGSWAVLMTLEEYSAAGWGVVDFLNFSQTLSIGPPTLRFGGSVGYSISGNQLSLEADRIDYACPFGVTGNAFNLRVELYAFATPFTGVESGWPIGHQDPGALACNYSFHDFRGTTAALDVPANAAFRTMFLEAQQSDGSWAYADYVNFASDAPPSSEYRLTVNVHGDGTVMVGPANVPCAITCSMTFVAGTAISLDAIANGGSTFTSWAGACSGSTAHCAFALDADVTVDATFSPASGSSNGVRVNWLASHGAHTCAALADGSVICWGANFAGQLGDGSYENRVVPVAVPGIAAAIMVAAGVLHSCVLDQSGQVACWGDNTYGQLGDGSVTSAPYPRIVRGIGTAVAIAAGAYHTCALGLLGEVWCWGENLTGELGLGFEGGWSQTPQLVAGFGPGSGVVSLAAGRGHTCAAMISGAVYCWGWNQFGQLGDATQTNRSVPTQVASLGGAGITSLAAGEAHTCVATYLGPVFCWGSNASGQIGDGTQLDASVPVPINAPNVARLVAGRAHTCATTTVGQVLCWGANDLGQTGLLPGPAILYPASAVDQGRTQSDSAIAAGADHTCVSAFGGADILCWGNNDAAQLGRVLASRSGTPGLVDRVNWNQIGIGGSWAFDDAPSQGILAQVFPDLQGSGYGLFFGGWFTYNPNGGSLQRWYTLQGTVYYGLAQQELTVYASVGGSFANAQPATLIPVGTATMQLADCSHGTITASIADSAGTTYWQALRIHRLLSNTNCAPASDNGATGHQLLSGAWAASTAINQGLVFEVNPLDDLVFGGWYTYLPNANPAAGPETQHWYSLQSAGGTNGVEFDDIAIYDTSGGVFGHASSPATVQVGSATLQFHSCSSATFSYQFSSGLHEGQAGSFDLHPVGPMPAACRL